MKDVFLFCFIPIVLIQNIAGQAGVVLVPSIPNKSITKKDEENFQVECKVSTDMDAQSQKDAVIQWIDKNQAVVTNRYTSINPYIRTGTSGGLSLGFRNTKEDDAGIYTCRATVNGNTYEDYFELKIQATLKFSKCDEVQNGLIGTSYDIECIAAADGLGAIVTWEFNNLAVNYSSNKYRNSNTALTILNVTPEDEGVYGYVADIPIRSETVIKEILFKAVEKPRFVGPIKEQTAVVGKKAELFCTAIGRPMPSKIVWKKEGESLEIIGTDRITVSDGVHDENGVQKILTIKEVKREDMGRYICTAYGEQVSGQDLTASQSLSLKVLIPPTIPDDINAPVGVENNAATIKCTAYGDPAPEMVWQKLGTDEQYLVGTTGTKTVSRNQMEENGMYKVEFSLTFNPASSEDAASYRCKAKNDAGNASKEVEFVVDFGPKFNDLEGEFYTWRPSQSGGVTTTDLKCKVKSNPKPSIQWAKDGNDINVGQEYYGFSDEKTPDEAAEKYLTVSTLKVSFTGNNPEVLGEYTCRASNHVSREEASMQLIKAETPLKPVVQINEDEATMLSFYLTAPDVQGPPIERFKVVYSRTAVPDQSETQEIAREIRPIFDEDRKYTILRIENLNENTEYAFTFYSISPAGESNGYELIKTTPPIQVPHAVKILTESNVATPTMIMLRWEQPNTGGSPIERYTVTYQRVTVQEDEAALNPNEGYKMLEPLGQDQSIPDVSKTLVQIKGLLPGNYYMVRVTAHNLRGAGPPGQKVIKTAEDPNYQPVGDAPRPSATYVMIVGCLAALYACLKSFV